MCSLNFIKAQLEIVIKFTLGYKLTCNIMHKIYLCLFQWSLIARLIQNLIQKIKVIFVKIQTYEFLTTITFIILSMINIPCSWFITVYDNSYYIIIPIFRCAFWFWINHRQKHMQTYVNCSITNCTWFGNLKKNLPI